MASVATEETSMNVSDWRNGADPRQMLKSLPSSTSNRKRALFAAGCCRRLVPYRGARSAKWPCRYIPLKGLEAIAGAIDLAERTADARADEHAWDAYRSVAGVEPPWGWNTDAILGVLRGDEEVHCICDAIATFFLERLWEVWVAAAELARAAAWSAWEVEESARAPYWEDMRAELEETRWECENHLVDYDNRRWLNNIDEVGYAEEYHGYEGRRGVWQNRWETVWRATWDEAWLRDWPPWSGLSSRHDISLLEWGDRWNHFAKEVAQCAWEEGRNRPLDWQGISDVFGWSGLDEFEDASRSWLDTEIAAVCADVFYEPPNPATRSVSWLTPAVIALADTIYRERQFNALPALADAVAQSSCEDALLLEHLRAPGPHVRGCWALDGILGKS
jgi:hypothetical protein